MKAIKKSLENTNTKTKTMTKTKTNTKTDTKTKKVPEQGGGPTIVQVVT